MASFEGGGMDDPLRNREFLRLFTRNSRALYAYILTLTLNQSDADDIYQETTTVLWEKFDAFEPDTNFHAWACRIAYFEVHNFRKRQGRLRRVMSNEFLELVAQETTSLADELEARQQALQDCLAKLSAEDRGLIDRRYLHSETPKQIAAARSEPPYRVYRALSRIHDALQRCVQRTLNEGGQ